MRHGAISIAIDQQLMPIHMLMDMVVHHMLHLMHMDMVLVQVLMPILMLIHMLMDMVVVEFVKRVKYVIISDEQVCKCDN